MTATARKRSPTRRAATLQQDGPLQLALSQLTDAVHALTAPQPAMHNNHVTWIDSRYQQLRDALYGSRGASGHHSAPSSLIPTWVDSLKLVIAIDSRTAQLDAGSDTPTRLQHVLSHPWRPCDTRFMETIATEIMAFAKAIDDLFSSKPIFLPDPCPHCRQSFTYRLNDEGERVRSPALLLTVENGATCLACHDSWKPDRLVWLGKILGYQSLEGVIAG